MPTQADVRDFEGRIKKYNFLTHFANLWPRHPEKQKHTCALGIAAMKISSILKILGALSCVIVSSAICNAADRIVNVSVTDADSDKPLPARLYLTNESNTSYYFQVTSEGASAVKYEKQNWLDKQSVEYHTTVSAHKCFAEVPSGRYTLILERGKSYRPTTRSFEVGDQDIELNIKLQRWSDPAAAGWYSGDTHLHRTVEELRNVVVAEDLNVALPLTSWVTLADKPPASGDKNIQDAKLSSLIEIDKHHVIWPRNTEYEIFSVGGKRHTLGALFVLGHRDSLQQTVPPWKPVIDGLKVSDPQVLFDMDKLDWPFAMVLPTLGENYLYELANNHVWRTKFAFKNWNTQAPSFIHPPFGSQIGGHRAWLDYTHGMYYTLLNCGLRLPPSAGTANGVHPVPAGFSRVYVHLPEGFSFDAWMQGLKQGRSFVTTGPMLFATADNHDPGHVFQRDPSTKTPIEIKMEVVSEQPILYGEVLINGVPEQLLRAQNTRTDKGAYRSQLSHSFVPDRSGWFAVRFWESQANGQVRFAHSAPWYVEIGKQPVYVELHEKQYLIDRVRQEITRSNGIVSPEAMHEYQGAIEFYQTLPIVEGELPGARTTQSTAELERWLDNMIIDHRFTTDEVRMATGLAREQAEEEVRKRALKSHEESDQVRVLPYPGGRHPRRGFLDGAINPQRETKISVFPPWKNGGYVVIDVPEAVFSNLGLTYLAHTHIPTIWDKLKQPLERLEWTETADGYTVRRQLPNGIRISSQVTRRNDGVDMQIELTNGTEATLTGLRVQVCTMLKGAVGFNLQQPLESIVDGPIIAIRGVDEGEQPADRWIVTWWTPNHRVWMNPPVPCFHSDPVFPDCEPGKTVSVSGSLRFYEGQDVRKVIDSERVRL